MSELRTNRIVPRDGLTSGTFSGGGVIQVKQTVYTGTDSANGNIAVALTDFESSFNCAITPTRSDSKILVEMAIVFGITNNNNIIMTRLRRKIASGSFADVDGALGAASDTRYRCTSATWGRANEYGTITVPIKYLDSPSTTSACTYSISVAHDSGSSSQTIYLNRSSNDGNNSYIPRSISTITLTEITG